MRHIGDKKRYGTERGKIAENLGSEGGEWVEQKRLEGKRTGQGADRSR